MPDQNAPDAVSRHLGEAYMWLGQPDDAQEHLLMMLTDGGEGDGSQVYRPLLAVSLDHAHQLLPLAQQASDGLNVPVVLREYLSSDRIAGRLEPIVRLEPRS